MVKIKHIVNTTTRMVVVISEKRCGFYAHTFQDEYEMNPKLPIYNKHDGENPKSTKHNLRI